MIKKLSFKKSFIQAAFVILMLLPVLGFGQSMTNYSFSYSFNGSLVDISDGATTLMTGSQNDAASAITNIGFTFYFMGVPYTQFSANSNGQISLGSTNLGGAPVSGPIANVPIIAPMSYDGNVQNGMSCKVIGTAPNRTLVIEWNQFNIFNGNITLASNNMQALLYEGSGKIDFIYGELYCSSGFGQSRATFISSSNTSTTCGYVTVAATPTFTVAAAPVTNYFLMSDLIANLGSTDPAHRTVYTFTPSLSPPAAPTSLNFTSVSATSMTLNWTDFPTTETGYAIFNSTDGVNYSLVTSLPLPLGATTYTATGFNSNTTYYWQVFAINEGKASSALSGSQATTAPTLSGIKYVGTGTNTMDYATLTDAFAAINTNGLAGNMTLILNTTYTTTDATSAPIAGPGAGAVGAYTINIYPSVTGLSITSANATGTINLAGCKNIIFDGRVGGTGSAQDLIIANTNVAAYAIQFINGTNHCVFKYCKINSVNQSISSGTIVFGTTSGSSGNSNNTIDNCNIYNGTTTPFNAIFASGSTSTPGQSNSSNTISNCNIYNFFNSTSTAADNGIYLSSGNTDWTITGNSFYQTSTRNYTIAASHTAIYILNPTGNNFNISGNFIGGGDVNCGGNAWTVTGNGFHKMMGIYLSAGATTASSVQGNTINNFNITGYGNSTQSSINESFDGINIISGNVNVGDNTGNTIGNATIDKIKFTFLQAGTLVGINSSSKGTVNITNNTIYGITGYGNTTSTGAYITGIQTSGTAGNYTIKNNIIGSTTVANSLRTWGTGTNTGVTKTVGIWNTNTGTTEISQNTIGNLVSNGTSTTSIVGGIFCNNSGINTIKLNTVRDLSTTSKNVSTTWATTPESAFGISVISYNAGSTVSQNTIFGLNNTSTGVGVYVTGIYFTGATGSIVERNQIYNFGVSSIVGSLTGIETGGAATYQNNVIRLGYDALGNVLSTARYIYGIYDKAGTNNFYFNSVYLGGTVTDLSTSNPTYAFNSLVPTNPRIFQNNIFDNSRSNATSGSKHYAIRLAGTAANPTGLTSNKNLIIANGTGGIFGYFNSADVLTLGAWKTATGQDANSISADPLFKSPITSTPDLSLLAGSPAIAAGTPVTGITADFAGTIRNVTNPTMGAYEYQIVPNVLNVKVFLEADYNAGTGVMNTPLNTAHLIPLTQPFSNGTSWSYAGTETVGAIPSGVVDWVLVELRDAPSPDVALSGTKLSGWPRPFFLKSDGSIVDLDGVSRPNIGNPTVVHNLYLIVRHRDHLGIMSANGMTLTGSTYGYDFTTAGTQVYGVLAGYKQIAPGVYGMVGGDVDGDGSITVLDFSQWAIDFGKTGVYLSSDIDGDGQVTVLDFSAWALNFGIQNPTPLKSMNSLGTGVKYTTQIPGNK